MCVCVCLSNEKVRIETESEEDTQTRPLPESRRKWSESPKRSQLILFWLVAEIEEKSSSIGSIS